MTSKLYPDVLCFASAIEIASTDRATWSAGERAALKRSGGQDMAPVIRMKRRCFYVVGRFTIVVERARGGFTVARVPSS